MTCYMDELRAMRDSALSEAVRNRVNKNAAEIGDGTKFSVREVDGQQIAWIENSSLSNKDLRDHKKIAEYIGQHIGEAYTVIESGQRVYIGEDLPSEYTQSEYTKRLLKNNPATLKAKNRASDALGDMIEIASGRRWEKTKHTHTKDAKFGMYRYNSWFAFAVNGGNGTPNVHSYDVELLIRNASDGKKYLYDIVNIKKNTAYATELQQMESRRGGKDAASRNGVSDTSIRSSSENSNTKIKKSEREIAQERGRRRTEIYAELQKLKAERDDLLRQDADYTAAQEKRRYATTFRERVDATRALNAAKVKIDTAELDERIQALQDERSAIDDAERAEHEAAPLAGHVD